MSGVETTIKGLDLDALAAALELPRFTLKGTTYEGALMGYLDFNRITTKLDRVAIGPSDAPDADVAAVLREALAAMRFAPEAQDALLGAPRPVVQRVLNHFFALHRYDLEAMPAPGPVTATADTSHPS